MSFAVDRFSMELRSQVEVVSTDLHSVEKILNTDIHQAINELRRLRIFIIERILSRGKALADAKQQTRNWNETEKWIREDTVIHWKAKRDLIKLQDRADRAEKYARAMLVLAKNAIDEVEEAVLEACIATYDIQIARET